MIIVEIEDAEPPVEPPPPLPPPDIPEFGFSLEILTATAIWDLSTGPVHALSGASGFGVPDIERFWQDSPALNGSIHKGYRVPRRELPIPIEIKGTTTDEWLVNDRAFWKSIDPDVDSYLRLTMPDATSRFIPVRINTGGDPEIEIDPMLTAMSLYELQFTAGDPFWRGEHIQVTYDTTALASLFPGPPFDINSSHTVETSRVTNPGDVPAWPRWVINGPYSSATVGVGDSLVTLSQPINLGDTRIIDMDPSVRFISDASGVDKWLEATVVEFEPIPPGTDVELELTVVGSSVDTHIELHFDSRYRRAW